MTISFAYRTLFCSAILGLSTLQIFAAQKERFFAYRSFWPEFRAMKNFSKIGVDTIAIMPSNTVNSLGEPYCKYPVFWRGKNAYDWNAFDKQFDDVIAANPNAKIICIVDLNSPPWLARVLSFGHAFDSDSFSMLSNSVNCREWRRETEQFLKDYLDRTEKKYGDRIAAYMLACGHTDEWLDYAIGGASRCKLAAFNAWQRKNGKKPTDIPALSKIHNASFENILRDPSKESDVLDFAAFANQSVGDAMIGFAKTARSKISPDKQIGSFFGYVHRAPFDGHYDYKRVFESEYFDFFVSPGNYPLRAMGEGSGFMSTNATRERLGKGWLHEIDHRTHTFNHQLSEYVRIKNVGNWETQEEDTAGLKREFSLATINHTSLWCFDMWGGVYDTPETLETVKRGAEIWRKFAKDTSPSKAEIAVIYDTASASLLNQRGDTAKYRTAIHAAFTKIGAPIETFAFEDIGKCDLSKYRLVVFPHLFVLTPERRALLGKYVLRDGKTVLTSYAPAICDGENLDVSRVKNFTGFDYGAKGVNTKQMDGWNSVYIHDPQKLSAADARKIAERAGVRFYVDENVPVYANEKLLCIHVKVGGKKTVRLDGKYEKVVELYSGKVVAENADSFVYEFNSPDTALFELQK